MQIRPYGLLCYDHIEWYGPRRKSTVHHSGKPLIPVKPYSGALTDASRKRLRRAIQLITAIAKPKTAVNHKTGKEFKFKLNFITLTLPAPQGEISDKEIKSKVLDVWLKAAKRRFKLNSYIWRAERQQNRNLHFHLITDCYIPYDQLRDTWNNRLEALNFITAFERKQGHRHPNSTDVHAIKNVRNLSAYFSKYMSKDARTAEDAQGRPPWNPIPVKLKTNRSSQKFHRILTDEESKIEGKVWDCSTNLKTKNNCGFVIDTPERELLSKVTQDSDVKVRSTDQCMIVFLNAKQFARYVTGRHREKYEAWLESIRRVPEDSDASPPGTGPPTGQHSPGLAGKAPAPDRSHPAAPF